MVSPVKDRDSGKKLLRKPTYELQTVDLSCMLNPPTAASTSWLPWRPISSGTTATSRSILRGVSFKAKPGEILAIAGPSGSGKTTLLEILAGKELPGRLSSEVLVNGCPMDGASYRRISGYVTQDDDALYPLLTVEETLLYSARLRLPKDGNRTRRVKALLEELGLEHVTDSRISGGNVRGISGGEKRRVSIGVDLVHNPAVLILDEPTSGLDSGSALQVVSMLKFMAENQGKTIVMSIHQPGVRIFELVSHVLLLGDGSVVHHGTMDELQAKLIKSNHCIPPHMNVLEFAIDVIQSLKIIVQATKPIEKSKDADGGRNVLVAIAEEELPISVPGDGSGRPEPATFRYANSAVNEVGILSDRFCKNVQDEAALHGEDGSVDSGRNRAWHHLPQRRRVAGEARLLRLHAHISSLLDHGGSAHLPRRAEYSDEGDFEGRLQSGLLRSGERSGFPAIPALSGNSVLHLCLLAGGPPERPPGVPLLPPGGVDGAAHGQFLRRLLQRRGAQLHNGELHGFWLHGMLLPFLRILHCRGQHTQVLALQALYESLQVPI